jgi:hypothetical protein
MNGDPAPGDPVSGQRFQVTRPEGAGLFWPNGRHLFRRRRAPALRIALALAGSAALLLAALLATFE